MQRRCRSHFVDSIVAVALAFSAVGLSPVNAAQGAEEADADLIQLVIGLLEDPDKDVRALGFEQVRTEAKGASATRQFAALLPKLSPESQAALLSALAERKDAAALPAVRETLTASGEASVRVAAIAALGVLGEPDDVGSLLDLLGADAAGEREAARDGLIRLGGETTPAAIAAAIPRVKPRLQATLIEILVARRAFQQLPAIVAAAADPDAAVRGAAISALGQLAGPEQMPDLVQAVLRAEPGAERANAEKAIMFVCRRTEDAEKRAEPLLAAINALSAADRPTLLPALGRVGGGAALAIIEQAIASPEASLHEAGIRSLCLWPDATIAPRLIELVGADKHPEHGKLALRALIRVAPLPDKRTPATRLELLKQALALCTDDADRNQVLNRAQAVRIVETLRFLVPYIDQTEFAGQACESIVELAHHRELRDANKAEFHAALDKVMQTSQDGVVVERARRYKNGQTWVRPKGRGNPAADR